MKNLLILTAILSAGLSVAAVDYGLPMGNLMNDVGSMQNTNSQLKLMQQQRFRQEEYNEFQDMKAVKNARNEKLKLDEEYEQIKAQQSQNRNIFNSPSDMGFVRENGTLMLKRID